MLPQLQLAATDWLLDRIDGPRWVVMSSAQLSAATPPPGLEIAATRERLAVERGATVIRPTMVFGGGGDQNITRLARSLVRTRVPIQLGRGDQLLQPIHVDDLCDAALIAGSKRSGGVLELGGRDRLTSRELLTNLVELLGLRIPIVSCPDGALSLAARLAPLAGLRPDQVVRLHDDKIVDASAAFAALGWRPAPTAHRLEQAIAEAGLGPRQGV